jgi:hypothetical protein
MCLLYRLLGFNVNQLQALTDHLIFKKDLAFARSMNTIPIVTPVYILSPSSRHFIPD